MPVGIGGLCTIPEFHGDHHTADSFQLEEIRASDAFDPDLHAEKFATILISEGRRQKISDICQAGESQDRNRR